VNPTLNTGLVELKDWRKRAEASGIRQLVDFSQRLRSYG